MTEMRPVRASEDVHELLLSIMNTVEGTHPMSVMALYVDMDGGNPEMDDSDRITKIAVIETPSEWVKTQDWYRGVVKTMNYEVYPNFEGEVDEIDYSVIDEDDVPTHLVRTLDLSNTGWNIPVVIDGNDVSIWHQDDWGGNPPAYQGCYEYSGGYQQIPTDREPVPGCVDCHYDYEPVGHLINDPEALEWVGALYNDNTDSKDGDDGFVDGFHDVWL